VTLSSEGQTLAPGIVVDVTAEGAGVRFALGTAPNIAIGQRVELEFASQQQKILTVPAFVRFRREEETVRRYGLEFLDRELVETQLPPALARLFNRRGAFRVRPDPARPIAVTLEGFVTHGSVERTTVDVIDLSVTGMAVTVDSRFEQAFTGNVELRVSMEVPGYPDDLNLGAVIHYRKLAREGVHYGIGFDPSRTANFEKQRRAIMDYVVRRYREEQREKKR
jgi:c-di-GMP-binding flagellar brake protein YcgR